MPVKMIPNSHDEFPIPMGVCFMQRLQIAFSLFKYFAQYITKQDIPKVTIFMGCAGGTLSEFLGYREPLKF